MAKTGFLRLPVVSAGAEYLVMGYLLRRNILVYKAPPNNEGYDLIAIHPDPRHRPKGGECPRVRIQVKSRYQTDCDRGFPVTEGSLAAFDYLIIVFLNVGKFFGRHDGSEGESDPEFYTLSRAFIHRHLQARSVWQKVKLRGLESRIQRYKDREGFEQIARDLGVPPPRKDRSRRGAQGKKGPDTFRRLTD